VREGEDRSGLGSPPLREPALEPAREEWKTSLVFWGPGAERPGWLVRCLDEFARREINLTKIESRPRPGRLGSYMFFADLSGRPSEEPVAAAIAGVRGRCEQVRVLGAYRAGQDPHVRAG
jgi:prephenate dehydratase